MTEGKPTKYAHPTDIKRKTKLISALEPKLLWQAAVAKYRSDVPIEIVGVINDFETD